MTILKQISLGVLIVSALAYAGGAASIVGKKSKTTNFTYNFITERQFINECAKGANEAICHCVLGKLQLRYSEDEYKKLDADLSRGIELPDFVKYITNASVECDAEYADTTQEPTPSNCTNEAPVIGDSFAGTLDSKVPKGMSEEEVKAFVKEFKKNLSKKDFLQECSANMNKFLGPTASKKSCGCFYDRLTSDEERLTRVFMEKGLPADNYTWANEYLVECVPEKFTPEIEKNLVNYLNETGVPLSIGKCLISTIKREYTLKSFFKASFEDEEGMQAVLMFVGVNCFAK